MKLQLAIAELMQLFDDGTTQHLLGRQTGGTDTGIDPVRGHCQRKVARTEFSTDDRELGRPELTPLGKRGGAVELEIVS